ncbi:hypothetical protein T03_11755 [Trichinella britovi]|uniref:Uncharacterized protein n=1 Tax=Trichinella britovi TaxID=45882 RepID=A0A0V1CSA8_TRIBR|nr:hypothetical protein T03_11755 [Trichinella britovi]
MTSIGLAKVTRRRFCELFRGGLSCMLRTWGASPESKNAGFTLSRLTVFVLFWQQIVIVLPARLSTKYGPSYVGDRGGRGASFRTKTCVQSFNSFGTNHFRDRKRWNTERHSHVFKKAERCRDGRLWNIFFRHRDLLIGADQVNFGEDRPAAQLCDEVIDVGDRVSVGLRHVVEASIISTWAPGVWLFLWDHVKR